MKLKSANNKNFTGWRCDSSNQKCKTQNLVDAAIGFLTFSGWYTIASIPKLTFSTKTTFPMCRKLSLIIQFKYRTNESET